MMTHVEFTNAVAQLVVEHDKHIAALTHDITGRDKQIQLQFDEIRRLEAIRKYQSHALAAVRRADDAAATEQCADTVVRGNLADFQGRAVRIRALFTDPPAYSVEMKVDDEWHDMQHVKEATITLVPRKVGDVALVIADM